MIDIKLRYTTNISTAQDVLQHLEKCDTIFVETLLARVVLNEYAEKLFRKAVRFEAWDADQLVGLIAAYMNDETAKAYITNVSVCKGMGGRGIASVLMQNCIAYCCQKNIEVIELEVKKDNDAAIALYHKFFFTEVRAEGDAIIMKHKIEEAKQLL